MYYILEWNERSDQGGKKEVETAIFKIYTAIGLKRGTQNFYTGKKSTARKIHTSHVGYVILFFSSA